MQSLFNILCFTILVEGLIVIIIGTLYVIEQLVYEVFNYDILKWCKNRRGKNNGNK